MYIFKKKTFLNTWIRPLVTQQPSLNPSNTLQRSQKTNIHNHHNPHPKPYNPKYGLTFHRVAGAITGVVRSNYFAYSHFFASTPKQSGAIPENSQVKTCFRA